MPIPATNFVDLNSRLGGLEIRIARKCKQTSIGLELTAEQKYFWNLNCHAKLLRETDQSVPGAYCRQNEQHGRSEFHGVLHVKGVEPCYQKMNRR